MQVLEESGQVSGENVEANPVSGRNLDGLCEDAEGIGTSHLKTIIFITTTELWQVLYLHTNVLVFGLRM